MANKLVVRCCIAKVNSHIVTKEGLTTDGKPLDQHVLSEKMCCMSKLGCRIGTLQMIETLNQTVHYSGFIYLRNSTTEAVDGSPNY